MTYEQNVRAILESNFAESKDEIVDIAVRNIMTLSENKGDLISRQAVLDELEKWDWQELYLPIHFKQILDDVPSVENKGDLISRTEVINAIDEREDVNGNVNAEDIRTDICLIPSKSDKGEWIPVSERLPEDYDRVLITVNGCRGLIVREARYYKARNEFEVLHNHERWKVEEKGLLAWMPLPEPYKAEKGGECE